MEGDKTGAINIDFDLRKMGCVNMKGIELTQDFVQWGLFLVLVVCVLIPMLVISLHCAYLIHSNLFSRF